MTLLDVHVYQFLKPLLNLFKFFIFLNQVLMTKTKAMINNNLLLQVSIIIYVQAIVNY